MTDFNFTFDKCEVCKTAYIVEVTELYEGKPNTRSGCTNPKCRNCLEEYLAPVELDRYE